MNLRKFYRGILTLKTNYNNPNVPSSYSLNPFFFPSYSSPFRYTSRTKPDKG